MISTTSAWDAPLRRQRRFSAAKMWGKCRIFIFSSKSPGRSCVLGLTYNYKLVDLFDSKNNCYQRQPPRTNRFGGSGDFWRRKWNKNVAFTPFLCGVAGAGITTLMKAGYVISLYIYYSIHLHSYLSIYLFIQLSIYLLYYSFTYLSIFLFLSLYLYLLIYKYLSIFINLSF